MSTEKTNFASHAAPRLTEERKRLGLSQVAAAEACGVSREGWGKYERGQAVPGADVLMKFAAAGADVGFILTGEGELTGLSKDECELLALFRSAPLSVKAAAVGALKGGMSNAVGILIGGSVQGQVVQGDLNQRDVAIRPTRRIKRGK